MKKTAKSKFGSMQLKSSIKLRTSSKRHETHEIARKAVMAGALHEEGIRGKNLKDILETDDDASETDTSEEKDIFDEKELYCAIVIGKDGVPEIYKSSDSKFRNLIGNPDAELFIKKYFENPENPIDSVAYAALFDLEGNFIDKIKRNLTNEKITSLISKLDSLNFVNFGPFLNYRAREYFTRMVDGNLHCQDLFERKPDREKISLEVEVLNFESQKKYVQARLKAETEHGIY